MAYSWDRERLDAAVSFVRARLAADFAHTGLPGIEIRVDGEPRPEDVVLVCGEHGFSLGLENGAEVACADAAYVLQDDVMDLVGHPWPELLDADGNRLDVLIPSGGRGTAQWLLGKNPFCAVGHLHEGVRAAGLMISSAPT